MANISDIIEEYILSTIGGGESVCISRNGLATFFNCAPSQINYVLTTRFSLDRGFIIESRRGGGGYLTVIKINEDKNEYIIRLLQNEIGQSISYLRAAQILKKLVADTLMTEREMDILLAIMGDKTLFFPEEIKDRLRANILRAGLIEILVQ